MDYEKKYKEAFERARIWQNHLYDTNDRDYADELNYIFPELKENEDERIRKAIISGMKALQEKGKYTEFAHIPMDDVFAWLEKQGEQKQDVSIQISPSEYVNDMGGNGCYLKNTTQTFTWSKKEEKVDNFKNYMKEE